MTAASPAPAPAPVTPGQAAYEAFYAGTECGVPVPWAELTDWNEHWNAAAQAAIDVSDSTALAQLAMAQEAISDLAAERDQPAPELAAAMPEPPLEVRPGGAVIVRPEGGDTLVVAFAPDVPAGRIAEVSHNLHHASGLKVIAVADIAAVRAWHPHDAPAELAAAMAETRQVRECLVYARQRLTDLACSLDRSAALTVPSKKSDIERRCAQAVREALAGLDGA